MTNYRSVSDPLVMAVADTAPGMTNYARLVIEEIFDEAFESSQHGKRSTRNKGCTGPLCMKALRDSARARARMQALLYGGPTKHSSRSRDYIKADAELHRIQTAYEETYSMWRMQELEKAHTLLLIRHVTRNWKWGSWESVPATICQYAERFGIAA
jgi:hypothetical protein